MTRFLYGDRHSQQDYRHGYLHRLRFQTAFFMFVMMFVMMLMTASVFLAMPTGMLAVTAATAFAMLFVCHNTFVFCSLFRISACKGSGRALQPGCNVCVHINPAKRNVLDLKNETCKNREKRNVQKVSRTRRPKATKRFLTLIKSVWTHLCPTDIHFLVVVFDKISDDT